MIPFFQKHLLLRRKSCFVLLYNLRSILSFVDSGQMNARLNYYAIRKMSDVFISYCWKYRKDFVDSLYEFLVENGLTVWKDDKGGMSGNMFEDMKKGIDGAK